MSLKNPLSFRLVNTIIESKGFESYAIAGLAMDAHSEQTDMQYNYRPMYINKGFVVGVYGGSVCLGYLAEKK